MYSKILRGILRKERNMDFNDDGHTVCLKEKDLEKLRDPKASGVEFEVDEYNKDGDEEDGSYFKPEDVFSNTYMPEEDNSGDEDDGLSPFEKLAKKMEDITGDGGVKKRILHPGGGSVVPEESIVRLHYNAFLEYADEPYDSTRLRNAPERYKLGQGNLLVGLEIAINTMKKGEIAQLLISPDYAYGEMGVVPRIPPKATIMFKLELLNFVEHAGIEDYDMMTKEERDAIEFPQVLKFVEVEKQFGKQQYNEKAYSKAFSHYKRASNILENRNVKDKAQQEIQEEKLLTLFTNMAICSSKMNKFGQVITYCKKAKNYDHSNVKILFLLGKAHRKCSNFEVSRELLKKAQRLSPNSPEINTELQQLDSDIKKFSLLEKDMYKKMFSKPTGQSESEKEKEDEHIKEKENKALKVSENFQKMVENKLLEFINDKDQDEMPFPAYNLSVGEIACMMEKAIDLELSCKEIGSGENYRLKITKRQNQDET